MARQRKLSPERKAFIDSLLEHYQPQDAQDVQNMLKDLLGCFLQVLFGKSCKIFLENVASPNWRILQSLAGSYSASRIAIADSI